jgi:hypothetical protein
MWKTVRSWLCPIPDMPWWLFALRVAWINIQIIVAYCLAAKMNPFFYQRF